MNVDNVLSEISNRKVKYYLEYVIKKLKKLGIPLHLDAGLCKIGPNMVGYFSEADGVRCYIDLTDHFWVSILAHEMGHVSDYYNNRTCWTQYQELDYSINDIIENKVKVKNKIRTARILINLEHSAETAAIKTIKKFNLPVDLNYYIQIANLTLWKYIFAINNNGEWVKLSVKTQDQVAKTMPIKLIPKENFIWSKMPVLLKEQLKELRIK